MNPIVFVAVLVLAAAPQLREQVLDAEVALYKDVARFRNCEGDGPSPLRIHRFDAKHEGDFYEVDRFLHQLAFEPNREFEMLRLKAVDGGRVRLEARLAEACWDLDWVPPPPVNERRDVEQFLRDRLQEVQSYSAEVARLRERMRPLRLTYALRAAQEAWSEHSVLLSEVQLADSELTLRGVALGVLSRGAIEPALRKAGFDVARVDWTPAGDCRAFTAVVRLSPHASGERQPVPHDLFDERTAALCNAVRSDPRPLRSSGGGDITIKARDVHAGALFMILHELNPAVGYVLGPEINARVDADLDGVSMDAVFETLQAAGAAFVDRSGSLWRVCGAPCAEPAVRQDDYKGEPVTMTLSDAAVADVFRLLRDVTGLDIYARELPGHVAIYARDVPWDRLFDVLVASLGRRYEIEGTGVYLDRDGVPVEKLIPPARRTLIERDPKKIAVEDLRLAAMVQMDGSWMAWARVPGSARQLFRLERGLAFHDGTVDEITGGKVILRTAKGPKEISLP